MPNPFHPCQQVEDVGIIAGPPGVQPLIKIDCDPHADDLLDLLQPKIRCQHVVVEQYSPAFASDKLPDWRAGADASLFVRNNAPRTGVHAAASEKPVCLAPPPSVQRIIWTGVLDFIG